MTPARCGHPTRSGEPCKAFPLSGQPFCGAHASDESDTSRARTDRRWNHRAFLEAFAELKTVAGACRAAGVARATVYRERQVDEDFALAWADVEDEIIETLEREAFRRAHDGVIKPVVSAGKVVTTVTEFSDGLLMFLLKARRPELYRDRVDVNARHSGGLKVSPEMVAVSRDPAHAAGTMAMLHAIGAVRAPDLSRLGEDELETLERLTRKLEEDQ